MASKVLGSIDLNDAIGIGNLILTATDAERKLINAKSIYTKVQSSGATLYQILQRQGTGYVKVQLKALRSLR